MQKKSLWECGYFDVYKTVTQYTPYKKHIAELVDMLNLNLNSKILDLGCGTGDLLQLCFTKTKNIKGLDSSKAMLIECRNKFSLDNCFTQHDLSKKLPFENETFDAIVSNNVLGYLPDQKFFIQEVMRVLKIGGVFVIATMKKGFNPLKIFAEHSKDVGFFNTLKIIPKSIIVGHYNKKIVNNLNRGIFTGYDFENFRNLIEEYAVSELSFSESYAKQDIVARGIKIA